MLNNTIRNSQSCEMVEVTVDCGLSKLNVAKTTAANTPRFDQAKNPGRLLRRQRRRNRLADSAVSGWRVALW